MNDAACDLRDVIIVGYGPTGGSEIFVAVGREPRSELTRGCVAPDAERLATHQTAEPERIIR